MSNLFMNDSAFSHLGKVAQTSDEEEQQDNLSNILSLQLKKPKHWKWELTTARSCKNIALPRILLYDHKGKLLVDTQHSQEEQVIREEDVKAAKKRSKTSSSKKIIRSSTTNLATTIRQALEHEFNDLCIVENYIDHTPSTLRSPVHSLTPNSIDFHTNDLPDFHAKSPSNSGKDVTFKSSSSVNIAGLPTPPSTGTTSTTNTQTSTSNSSGPREKRRYRRSRSSGLSSSGPSSSILERFSFNKGRFSSPEFATEEIMHHSPRYYLATSKAGTIVVQKDSFSRYRRRSKTKHSSSDNVQSNNEQHSLNDYPPRLMARDSFECKLKKRNVPAKRHKINKGHVAQQQQQHMSSSEDEAKNPHSKNYCKQSNEDVVTIDPDNTVLCVHDLETTR